MADRTAAPVAVHPGYPTPGPQAPPAKKGGGVRKVFGVVLVVLGAIPLLGAGAIAAKAVSNSQLQLVNDAFLPKSWHNLPADQFFPDRFGVQTFGDGGEIETYAWARQGIDDASSCENPGLEPDLADAVREHGCQAVVRATYVDPSSTLVMTVVVAVVGSASDAESISEEFEPPLEIPRQRALAFPVAGTPAEHWTDESRGGVAISAEGGKPLISSGPFVVAVAVGYVDGRSVGVLPEPWTWPAPGSANERALDKVADHARRIYWQHVYHSIREMTR